MDNKDQILDTLPNYDADNAQMPNEVSGLNTQFEGNPFATPAATATGAAPAGTPGAPAAPSAGRVSRAAGQLRQRPWQMGLLLLAGWMTWRGLRHRSRVYRA